MTNMERIDRMTQIIGIEDTLEALVRALGEDMLGEYMDFLEDAYEIEEWEV